MSAIYIDVHGIGWAGQPLSMHARFTAWRERGPDIPSCAAVALIGKVAAGYLPTSGARPCVGEYLEVIDDPQSLELSVRFDEE